MSSDVRIVFKPGADAGHFTDNIPAQCVLCGVTGFQRPHNPPGDRICTDCFFSMDPRDIEGVFATEVTIEEVRTLLLPVN